MISSACHWSQNNLYFKETLAKSAPQTDTWGRPKTRDWDWVWVRVGVIVRLRVTNECPRQRFLCFSPSICILLITTSVVNSVQLNWSVCATVRDINAQMLFLDSIKTATERCQLIISASVVLSLSLSLTHLSSSSFLLSSALMCLWFEKFVQIPSSLTITIVCLSIEMRVGQTLVGGLILIEPQLWDTCRTLIVFAILGLKKNGRVFEPWEKRRSY